MKTLHKRFLITKDYYEDKASSNTKMQAHPYHEKEYWKKKQAPAIKTRSNLKKLDLAKLLSDLKHEGK